MIERKQINGLSASGRNEVEKLESHADVLLILKEIKELFGNKALFEERANSALEKLTLTEKEKDERNNAVQLINEAMLRQKEIRDLSISLDSKRQEHEKVHQDNLNIIKDTHDDSVRQIAEHKKSLEESKSQFEKLCFERNAEYQLRLNSLDMAERQLTNNQAKHEAERASIMSMKKEIDSFKERLA